MSKTIPTELMITDVSITNYHRTYSTEAMSGVVQRKDTGVQWFSGSITLQAYTFESVRILNGFLASLKGRFHAFELPLGGAYTNPKLVLNPQLNTSHNIGSNLINITFNNPSQIVMGSVFTVGDEAKLYTLLESINGSGTYEITPAFKRTHASLEEVNFKNPVITAFLDTNDTTITHEGNGMIARATLAWTENLT